MNPTTNFDDFILSVAVSLRNMFSASSYSNALSTAPLIHVLARLRLEIPDFPTDNDQASETIATACARHLTGFVFIRRRRGQSTVVAHNYVQDGTKLVVSTDCSTHCFVRHHHL